MITLGPTVRSDHTVGPCQHPPSLSVAACSQGCPPCEETESLAHVHVSHARDVGFERCEFAQLDSIALAFDRGAQRTLVRDCLFRDVGGAAYQLGRWDSADERQHARQERDNTLHNSLIADVGAEYRGAAAVQVFYAARTLIVHNAIVRSPYSAISLGWGWGRASYAASNLVEANRVHRYKLKLDDGGCLYTLSDQPGSVVRRNWCSGQHTTKGGALYPDEGSAHMSWHENVLERLGGSRWVHIWNSNASKGATCSELSVTGNFHDTSTLVNSGANITMRANRLVEPGTAWPPQARAIMAEAGPVDSPWRGSSAWLELGLDAEAAAALPLQAGGIYAAPSGQRQPVESRAPRLAAAPVRAVTDSDDAWCRRVKLEQRVTPGSSWGGLSKAGEAEWMRRRCDRFFCQPHAMESQGVYTCVPVGS